MCIVHVLFHIQHECSLVVVFVRCDGGVCNNSFLMQLISDLTDRSLNRPKHMDMTSLGAAFLAGLAVG